MVTLKSANHVKGAGVKTQCLRERKEGQVIVMKKQFGLHSWSDTNESGRYRVKRKR
jgi:hypothetical protein